MRRGVRWLGAALGCAAISCGGSKPRPVSARESAPAQVAPTPTAPGEAPVHEANSATPNATPSSETPEADVFASPDKSFEPPVYAASGVPDPTAQWTSEDYAAAGRALSRLARKNRLFLPREGSPNSGRLFAHLVSEKNLTAVESGDPKSRVVAATALAQIVPQFLALYAPSASDDAAFPREQVRWVELLLTLYPKALAAFREGIEPGLVTEDELRALEEVAVAVFSGAAAMLEEKARYRAGDLQILRDALARTGPRCLEELSPGPAERLRPHLPAHSSP